MFLVKMSNSDLKSLLVIIIIFPSAANQLERMTRHWPMVIGDTIIFNMLSVSGHFCHFN